MNDIDDNNLPVYMMLDEFGHLQIPSFDVFATTARKYKIGFWIFLQSLSQLEARYGRDGAQTILDGLQTEVYLPGVSLKTAAELSRRMGKSDEEVGNYIRERAIMNETEIIQLEEGNSLIFHAGRPPVKLKIKPFYKQYKMLKKSKIKAPDIVIKGQELIDYMELPRPVIDKEESDYILER
jgi:type IV secretory pathway TraG/TraD family ATPase VirD4